MSLSTTTTSERSAPVFEQQHGVDRTARSAKVYALTENAWQLGLWLSGLESFLNIQNHPFDENQFQKAAGRNWKKEFSLCDAALKLCSKKAMSIQRGLKPGKAVESDEPHIQSEAFLNLKEASELATTLKELVLQNRAFLKADTLRMSEWKAWSDTVAARLEKDIMAKKLIEFADAEGEKFLPAALTEVFATKRIDPDIADELSSILPRIAKVLKLLDVIGEMLEKDEPIKLALLLFARIVEQVRALVAHIQNRLLRFGKDNEELFGSLDGAAYAVGLQVRRVHDMELAGLSDIRQIPQVYAQIGAAYGILNELLQQTVVNFAQLADPDLEIDALYPNFKVKLEESLVLRNDMWVIQQSVQAAEKDPDKFPMDKLHIQLESFIARSMRFLMYKDWETMERFTEEVIRTRNKNDLVPILHRFGAYLETLLGQINMRAVLADHPFNYPKEK